jgi:hypothetical protein
MKSDEIYLLKKPIEKDNWNLFPDSTFSHLDTMDCNNTINGECYYNKTLGECIQTCEKSNECNFGYFITNTKDRKDICVPLLDIDINPIYNIRKQDIYTELDDTKSKVFVNKNKYKFPPGESNDVFFMDNLLIENMETNTLMRSSHLSDDINDRSIVFKKDNNLIVQLLEVPTTNTNQSMYKTLKYGDSFTFHIPNTTLIMVNNPVHKNLLEWESRGYSTTTNESYTIKHIMPGKKDGDIVLYSDIFSLHKNISILEVDSNHTLKTFYSSSYQEAVDKNKNVTFRFIPKIKGWYCNDDHKCTEIPLDKITVGKDNIGRYDGHIVGRNYGCWGLCNESNESSDSNESTGSSIVIITIITVILLFLVIIIYK